MNPSIDRLYLFLLLIPLITIHEFAHAMVATLMGDRTPRDEGRLTFNPLVHMDLFGTLIIPAINIFLLPGGFGFFAWGRPVPTNPSLLKNPRLQGILIALAGPLANIITAFFILLIAKVVIPQDHKLSELFATFVLASIFLAVFHLLPVMPFDGWTIIKNIFRIPDQWEHQMGIFWFIAILIFLNLPPVYHFLEFSAYHLFMLLNLLSGSPLHR
ncbi:site-2 protease family protein [Candidatus Methylacidiphilum fumarolicum]|uniref:Zn-dependent protease n=2 Tax=Candidatus Methylacidiphilum fumarolicum TaxID=591154 RepID=I0JW71_METFB|nr:site-2 protease family protein [Candidatus Methylacidiphilum fumarolicum]MBW6415746.1 site-2 protease family protein [Candidatus Methylacidiphilum fumarolicum]TFE65845.1 peptidase [Candidatus Methylacidiphilum fumarolicum]TFE71832.1 site-2 protease family protein [Candidatus Methylacidiphilum fumarolicum]TFE72028.1 site-2 protease family protein [Candidatus Methylacidiphilum fumarolicum]TFE76466.1 peptidase [Candidatus Methylacidiphilum fumarolicum]